MSSIDEDGEQPPPSGTAQENVTTTTTREDSMAVCTKAEHVPLIQQLHATDHTQQTKGHVHTHTKAHTGTSEICNMIILKI